MLLWLIRQHKRIIWRLLMLTVRFSLVKLRLCAWKIHCMILWLKILMDQNFLICLIFLQRQLLDLRLSKAKMLVGNLRFLIRLLMKIKRFWSKLRLRIQTWIELGVELNLETLPWVVVWTEVKLSSCGRKVCCIDSSQREIRLVCNLWPLGVFVRKLFWD